MDYYNLTKRASVHISEYLKKVRPVIERGDHPFESRHLERDILLNFGLSPKKVAQLVSYLNPDLEIKNGYLQLREGGLNDFLSGMH
jgi:hypothetical protein